LPGFKATFVRYISTLQKLSNDLLSLVAEALELPPNAFSRFFETGGNQDRAKIVKYPVPDDDSSNQGVGPHYDGGFLTLVSTFASGWRMSMKTGGLQLLQASPHKGLQVQNVSGDWVDAPPIPGTFVVNIGKG
jgi:isopenicillin N synthase-like dioxygenase